MKIFKKISAVIILLIVYLAAASVFSLFNIAGTKHTFIQIFTVVNLYVAFIAFLFGVVYLAIKIIPWALKEIKQKD